MDKELILESVMLQVRNDNFWSCIKIEGYDCTTEVEEGGEGQGDTYTYVFKIKQGEELMYVMAKGYYESYAGTDFSYCEPEEVIPYEKTVTAWKAVK